MEVGMPQNSLGRSAPASGPADVLLYLRLSDDDGGEASLSLPGQERMGLEELRRHPDWLLAGKYEDVMTGRRSDRPNYQALLKEARRLRGQGRRVLVLVKQVDRFGRKLSEMARAFEELEALGVELWSVKEGGPLELERVGIHGTFADVESRRNSQRVRDAYSGLAAGGWWRPGRVPWGYQTRPRTEAEKADGAPKAVLELHPAEQHAVETLFQRAKAGDSLHRLARWAMTLPARERGGRVLNYSRVRTILLNALYAGLTEDGRRAKWPALVDRPLWDGVAARMADASSGLPRQASGKYLLTGLLWCTCGARMDGHAKKGRSARYSCESAVQAKAACYTSYRVADVDAAVERLVRPLQTVWTADAEWLEDAEAVWEELIAEAQGARSHAADIRRLKGQLTRVEGMLSTMQQRRLLDRDDDDYPDDVTFRATMHDLRAKHETARLELARLEAAQGAVIDVPPLRDVLPELAGVWDVMDVAERRGDLAELLTRVVADRDEATGMVRVTPHWTLIGQALAQMAEQLPQERSEHAPEAPAA
jgi:DNA invertase Pin-like site-specific DNA recombinase